MTVAICIGRCIAGGANQRVSGSWVACAGAGAGCLRHHIAGVGAICVASYLLGWAWLGEHWLPQGRQDQPEADGDSRSLESGSSGRSHQRNVSKVLLHSQRKVNSREEKLAIAAELVSGAHTTRGGNCIYRQVRMIFGWIGSQDMYKEGDACMQKKRDWCVGSK